jgi:hypothetical protein
MAGIINPEQQLFFLTQDWPIQWQVPQKDLFHSEFKDLAHINENIEYIF